MTSFSLEPGVAAEACDTVFSHLDRLRFVEALWLRRLDVWSGDVAVRQQVANRLGWLDAVDFSLANLQRVEAFAESVRASGVSDVVLFGMGGSSLAPEVFHCVLGRKEWRPRFHMLDSTDPEAVRRALADAATSLFIVASKSGTTIEPNSMLAAARRRVETLGVKGWGSRFVAITDENTVLHQRAINDHFFDVFINPSDVGGRYSALTFVGIVPAAVMGIPLAPILQHARDMVEACRVMDLRANPGVSLGALMGAAAQIGRDKLLLLLPERLESLGLWIEQLVAESTGKHGKGIVPIANESAEALVGSDRVAVVVRIDGDPSDEQAVERLRQAGIPLMTIQISGPEALGAEFFRWQIATATAGRLLAINPFDEPNVREAKDATGLLLQAYTAHRELPMDPPQATTDGCRITLSRAARTRLGTDGPLQFLRLLAPGDYFALLAYLPPEDPAFAPVLRDLRATVALATGCATTCGYGPRYLHSTGQLHKGGANKGVFLIITAACSTDIEIPDAPFSFGVLEMAQALGDFGSLDRAGRRAVHVHLPGRDPKFLSRVAELLEISPAQT